MIGLARLLTVVTRPLTDALLGAEQRYGLPLNTAEGVRSVVHTLDLANVELPSIRRVIDQIVVWANG